MANDMHERFPAPWRSDGTGVLRDERGLVIGFLLPDVVQHVADLHNAECIMLRRGWYAERFSDGWYVNAEFDGTIDPDDWTSSDFGKWVDENRFDSPSEAILTADAWLKNREGKTDG